MTTATAEYQRPRWRAVIKEDDKVVMQGSSRKTQQQAEQDVLVLLRAHEINKRLEARWKELSS